MPTTLTAFTNAATIAAADLRSRVADVERYLNEQIATTDLQTAAWVDTNHIYPPDFFGSPHPRVEGVTFDVYHAFTGLTAYDWVIRHYVASPALVVPVPGATRRVWIQDASTWVMVLASATMYHLNGLRRESADVARSRETVEAARLVLLIDGTVQANTNRYAYENSLQWYAKHHHSMILDTTLNAGWHNVGIGLRIDSNASQAGNLIDGVSEQSGGVIYIESRSLVVIVDAK